MQGQEFTNDARIHEILNEYRRRQLTEAISGPGLSFMFHMVVLTLMFVFITTKPQKKQDNVEVIVVEAPMIEPLEEEPPEPMPPEPVEDLVRAPEFKPDQVPAPQQTPDDQQRGEPTDDMSDAGDVDQIATFHLNDVELTDSPIRMAALGRRGSGVRDGILTKTGTGPNAPKIIRGSLDWLQRVQQENGSWEDNPAHTGLALLCFLGYGEGPTSRKYGVTIFKAMQWLVREQQSKGHFGRAYSQGIATYAIADAYAMTGSTHLRPVLERAVERIIDGQQTCGGFDYRYKKGERWDLSVTGWQIQALKAAKMAGAANPRLAESLIKANKFLEIAYRDGQFCYSNEKAGKSGNMTGIGALSAQFLGSRDNRNTKSALATIAKERLPQMEALKANGRNWDAMAGKWLYGWYYDTQAVYFNQAKNPQLWKRWSKACMPAITRARKSAGYWEASKGHGLGRDLSGRILCTTWCLLQLEVSIRFLPSMSISDHDTASKGLGIDNIGTPVNGGPGLIVEIEEL